MTGPGKVQHQIHQLTNHRILFNVRERQRKGNGVKIKLRMQGGGVICTDLINKFSLFINSKTLQTTYNENQAAYIFDNTNFINWDHGLLLLSRQKAANGCVH